MACRAVLHNRVNEVCCTLTGTANPVIEYEREVVAVESEQTDSVVLE